MIYKIKENIEKLPKECQEMIKECGAGDSILFETSSEHYLYIKESNRELDPNGSEYL